MYGLMYLAVGMFPSCYMSSGGKLAPCNHCVNQFFASNEALANVGRRADPAMASDVDTRRNATHRRIDVQTTFHAAPCVSAGSRVNTGFCTHRPHSRTTRVAAAVRPRATRRHARPAAMQD